MHHSITFGDEVNGTKNTWTDWELIPGSPPAIDSPSPKTNFIDIPGRIKGPYDASLIPFNHQTFERITGSWEFVMCDDYWHTPNPRSTHAAIRGWLHGKRTKIVLEDEPNYFYYGLITVAPPEYSQGPFIVEISYDIEPVRYNSDGSVDTGWIPDSASWSEDPPFIPETIVPITNDEIDDLFDD